MKNYNLWIRISLFNFCIVGLFGFVLRSKILFDLPWINYLNVLDAHSHFAFGGWITLILLTLFIEELLPETYRKRKIYQGLLCVTLISSYGILVSMLANRIAMESGFSAIFILTCYVYCWMFIKDVRHAAIPKTVYQLSVSSIICLVLSSAGPIILTYLHATGSHEPFFYRDALYIYLHLQYNGFFSLGVFALLFYKLFPKISKLNQHNFNWFSILIIASILPSLFLSFLWQDPNTVFRIIAIAGSVLVFATAFLFAISSLPIIKEFKVVVFPVRIIIFLSITAFLLKMILQSFTIFTLIGNAVFGDRPLIIGFLHLVFLGFVSPFILAYLAQENILSLKIRLTRYALIFFMFFVICNEMTLMLEGLRAMFLKSSQLFSLVLWLISIGLTISITLVFASSMKSKKSKLQ